ARLRAREARRARGAAADGERLVLRRAAPRAAGGRAGRAFAPPRRREHAPYGRVRSGAPRLRARHGRAGRGRGAMRRRARAYRATEPMMRIRVVLAALASAAVAAPRAGAQRLESLSPAVRKYVRVGAPRVVLAHVTIVDGTGGPPMPDRNVTLEG